MMASLRSRARGRSTEAEAGFAHCYRAKILFAVGGFMGFADLKPLPIPLLVRYKLIDSCRLQPVSDWYVAAAIAVSAGG